MTCQYLFILGWTSLEAFQLFAQSLQRQADHVREGAVHRLDQLVATLLDGIRAGFVQRIDRRVIGVDLLKPAQDRASGAASNWAIFKQRWADAEEQGLSEEQKKWKANGYQNGGLYITPTGAWPDYLGPFPSPRR